MPQLAELGERRCREGGVRRGCAGGRAGGGWDFGRSVLKIDLYQVIEDIEGVDYVDKIRIFDEDSGRDVEQLKLGDDQLVHLVNVNVVERSHDRIL